MSFDVYAQEICIDKFSGFQYSKKRDFIIDELGRLLIATDGKGLAVYDGYDLTFFNPLNFPNAKVYNYLRDLEKLPDGTIISALEGLGTIMYGRDSSISFEYSADRKEGIYHERIESYWARNDTLIVGDRSGYLTFLNLKTFEVFKTINLLERHRDIIRDDKAIAEVFDILSDENDPCILWIAAQGLVKYNICTDQSFHFPQGENFVEDRGRNAWKSYSSYGMYELFQHDSKIFASSWGGGLCYFDMLSQKWKKELFEPYTDQFELDENIIEHLIQINDSIILVNGGKAFFFDVKNLKKIPSKNILDVELNSRIYSDGIIYNNKLYSGNKDEFCVYPLNDKYHDAENHHSKPYVKTFMADGKSMDIGKSIYPNYNHFIPKEFRNIYLDFRLPLPNKIEHVEYEYLLRGKSNTWKVLGTDHAIQLDNLSGGDYELQIRAREKGVNNPKWRYLEHPLSFSVEKYTSEKIWFKFLIALSISLLIFALIKYYVKTQKEKQQLRINYLKELQQTKLSALRARMNPHFLFNSLTSINDYVMHEEPRMASKYLTKFAHLMRTVLNNSYKDLIALDEELSALKLYTEMENIRFANRFDIHLDVHPDINTLTTFVPTMILQPFVENAIHHGLNHKTGKGKLKLYIEYDEDSKIKISITDDGIGRAAAQQIKAQKIISNKSMGMKITSDRIQLIEELYKIKTKINVKDLIDPLGEPEGTEVVLILPLINDSNKSDYDSN